MKTSAQHIVRVVSLGITICFAVALSSPAFAGPDYQALKACLQNCFATTAPWTWARLACVADCYADYVDSKISYQAPMMGLDPDEQGYGVFCEQVLTDYEHYASYPTCFTNLTEPFDVRLRTLEPATHVEVWALTDDVSEFMLLGEATPISSDNLQWQYEGATSVETAYLFVARFTDEPTEDLDEAAVFFAAGQDPVPADSETWGEIKNLFR